MPLIMPRKRAFELCAELTHIVEKKQSNQVKSVYFQCLLDRFFFNLLLKIANNHK